jgi:hypothetical protein
MKHDKQFSIEGSKAADGSRSRIFIDCFGGGDYHIQVRGKLVRFEWSEMFGPMPVNADGSEARSIGPRHGFWRAASLWNLQGRRIEDGVCVWHEPKKPVYEIEKVGRKNILKRVIEPGEEGWDW